MTTECNAAKWKRLMIGGGNMAGINTLRKKLHIFQNAFDEITLVFESKNGPAWERNQARKIMLDCLGRIGAIELLNKNPCTDGIPQEVEERSWDQDQHQLNTTVPTVEHSAEQQAHDDKATGIIKDASKVYRHEMTATLKICKECTHAVEHKAWHPAKPVQEDLTQRECHLYGPDISDDGHAMWPSVKAADTCSVWAAKGGAAE